MDLSEVMRTTFAARAFTDEPVPDSVLHRVLDHARFAPSGGNRQGWRVVIVRDPAIRAQLPALVEAGMKRYLAQIAAGESPWNPVTPTSLTEEQIAAQPVPQDYVTAMTQAPVLVFVFVDLSVVAAFDQELDRVGVIAGGSVYPFVWNILLAARNEGLGGTLTTFVGAREAQLCQLLGVPEPYAFAAMLPLGRPVKQLTRLKRKPVDSFATLERFDGAALTGS